MEKVYVDHTNQVKIICPKCRLEKHKIVFKFKDTHKRLKAKCRCGEVFRVTLDFRKHYRKNAQLIGEYFVLTKYEKGKILIEDISKTGIRFSTLKPHNISRNDIVGLKFTLDNPMWMEIHTLVKIIWIVDRTVGVQFNDPKLLENNLEVLSDKIICHRTETF